MDDIVATTVDAVLAEPPSAPADMAAEFAAMHLLSDEALFAAVQPSLSLAEAARLKQLNCVERVLLRRVGGGTMFIHRTMMEHIAALDLEKWKEQPDSP
jgi:hypothetical protein